jgi:hypothetical protein
MMSFSLLAMLALLGTSDVQPSAQPTPTPLSQPATAQQRFAGRPQARIAFTRQIQNFKVKREENDDILYLETTRNRWYRSEIGCFGMGDPRDAHAILPIELSGGFDSSSRILLLGMSREGNECMVRSVIELTTEEATQLRLIRVRTPRSKAAAPQSN